MVRLLTRRFIGDYDPNMERTYSVNTVMDNDHFTLEVFDSSGHHLEVFIIYLFTTCVKFSMSNIDTAWMCTSVIDLRSRLYSQLKIQGDIHMSHISSQFNISMLQQSWTNSTLDVTMLNILFTNQVRHKYRTKVTM